MQIFDPVAVAASVSGGGVLNCMTAHTSLIHAQLEFNLHERPREGLGHEFVHVKWEGHQQSPDAGDQKSQPDEENGEREGPVEQSACKFVSTFR
jgi:hypothetical protein